jgi:DNA-binding CsgD family transcriptional regulator
MRNHRRNRIIMELFAGGLTYQEIADFVGCSRCAVAGVVHRNRGAL